MENREHNSKEFISAAAEQLAIRDTLASLRILIPLVAFLQIILIVTWLTDVTGDKTAKGSLVYVAGYVFMFFASVGIWEILRQFSTDIPKYRKQIFHVEMTYAWMMPVWAAVLTLMDALNASNTYSVQFYVMANVLTMGICYMSKDKWTLIQIVTGSLMLISAVIMPLTNHFTFVTEFLTYIVITIIAGRFVFQMKTNSYERQAEQTEFLNKVEYDSLTGVYTREAFYQHVEELLEKNPATSYCLIVSDVQGFKQINSIYGNEKADELLRYLAHAYTKYGKITARYGADQFITVMPSAEKMSAAELNDVAHTIAEHAPVPNLVVKYGYYDIGTERQSVSIMSDRALLAAKSIQKDYTHSIAAYDGPVSQRQLLAQKIASDFRKSIDRQEFVMWYQPKVNPYTGKVVAAEALIRWKKPDGSVTPPGAFLDVFEENGQILELDEYVFRSVCRFQKRWIDSGRKLMPISVNLSRRSMARSDLVETYKGIVEETGIPMEAVPIEITESAAVRSVMIRPIAKQLHENGFTIHMDDFGSGQSSINGLSILDIDVVKIDKSLVDDIGQKNGNTLLKGLMGIIKELGLHMVAEGVERKEQLDFLMENHVDEIQGYYYSKPLPEDEFESFVLNN